MDFLLVLLVWFWIATILKIDGVLHVLVSHFSKNHYVWYLTLLSRGSSAFVILRAGHGASPDTHGLQCQLSDTGGVQRRYL